MLKQNSENIMIQPQPLYKVSSLASREASEKGIVTKDLYEVCCSICSFPIKNFIPKYFMGHQFNPSCKDCDDTSHLEEIDPFLSFPEDGMPSSLLAHWIPYCKQHSSHAILSLASHWILPYKKKPEVKLIPVEEVIRQFSILFEDLRKDRAKMIEEWSLTSPFSLEN